MVFEHARAAIAIANKHLRNACDAISLTTTRQSVSSVRGIDQTRIQCRVTKHRKTKRPQRNATTKSSSTAKTNIVIVSEKRKKLQKKKNEFSVYNKNRCPFHGDETRVPVRTVSSGDDRNDDAPRREWKNKEEERKIEKEGERERTNDKIE